MKLRLTKNSIRIRIRKSELIVLSNSSKIEESVQFPSGDVFEYELRVSSTNANVSGEMMDNKLIVSVPSKRAQKWFTTNEVGIEAVIRINDDDQLHLLIEKDFPCKDRPEEDKSDTFSELAEDESSAC